MNNDMKQSIKLANRMAKTQSSFINSSRLYTNTFNYYDNFEINKSWSVFKDTLRNVNINTYKIPFIQHHIVSTFNKAYELNMDTGLAYSLSSFPANPSSRYYEFLNNNQFILEYFNNFNLNMYSRDILIKFSELTITDFDESYINSVFDNVEDNEPTSKADQSNTNINIESVNLHIQSAADNTPDAKSFLKEFIMNVVNDLGVSAAKKIVQWLFFIVIAFSSLNNDIQISFKVQDVIDIEMDSREIKKVFLKNKSIEQPNGRMGYIRTSAFLRSGPNGKAPVVDVEKVGLNQTVLIFDRKGNWLKIYYENDENSGVGWIEESKVIKFKLD